MNNKTAMNLSKQFLSLFASCKKNSYKNYGKTTLKYVFLRSGNAQCTFANNIITPFKALFMVAFVT